MKQVIDGKLYDTDTATKVCDVSESSRGSNDSSYDDTYLYRSPGGQFFIAGEGGARSRWATPRDGNDTGGGSGIRLVGAGVD